MSLEGFSVMNLTNTTYSIMVATTDFWSSLLKYLGVAASIAVVFLLSFTLRMFLRKSLKPKMVPHIYNIIEKVIVYTMMFLGIVAALSPLGINLTGLLVAGGVAGIILGFASQTVFSNFLSGIFMYLERPIKPGDSVQVDVGASIGVISGEVMDIDALSTKIRSWDGYVVRIPNDKLFSSVMMNYSKVAAIRVVVDIGISYGSNIPKAREAILKALDKHPFVLVNPSPEVFVKEFGDSAIILRVRFWAPSRVWYETRKECLELIREELRNAGVEIPFPQLDLHVKEGICVKLSTEKSNKQKSSICQ